MLRKKNRQLASSSSPQIAIHEGERRSPEAESAGRPRYVQIIESLRQRLAAREWKPGDVLPGESSLAREYGVSHGTMRKAIDGMVAQSLLVRYQGKGTFVATHDWHRAVYRFAPLVNEDGKRELPSGRVVKRDEGVATADELKRLQLRAGSRVIRILRTRSFRDVPVIVERIVLPASRFPNFGAEHDGDLPQLLYGYYSERYEITVVEALEQVRAVTADRSEARLLGVPNSYPLLEIDRLVLDINQKPVEWRISRCDTKHYFYENRLS